MKSASASSRVLPFIPAVSEPIHSRAEAAGPYPPRFARALVVLLGAVSVHIWGIPAPHPQLTPLSAFASRMMSLPGVPLAPPLQVPRAAGRSAISRRSVVVENQFVRVNPLPVLRVLPRTLRAEQIPVPVGTSGRLTLATLSKPSPDTSRLLATPPSAPSSVEKPAETPV